MKEGEIKKSVKERYSKIAKGEETTDSCCCGTPDIIEQAKATVYTLDELKKHS